MANSITLNYRIDPKRKLSDLPRDRTEHTITINSGQTVSALETAIQNKLGAPFNEVPLDIRQIHPSRQC